MRCPYCAEDIANLTVVCPVCHSVIGPLPPTPGLKGAVFRLAGMHHLLGSGMRRARVGLVGVPLRLVAYGIWSRATLEEIERFDATPQGWELALRRFAALEPVYWTNVWPPACPKCDRLMQPMGWMIDAGTPAGRMQPTVYAAADRTWIGPGDPLYTFKCRRCSATTLE